MKIGKLKLGATSSAFVSGFIVCPCPIHGSLVGVALVGAALCGFKLFKKKEQACTGSAPKMVSS